MKLCKNYFSFSFLSRGKRYIDTPYSENKKEISKYVCKHYDERAVLLSSRYGGNGDSAVGEHEENDTDYDENRGLEVLEREYRRHTDGKQIEGEGID